MKISDATGAEFADPSPAELHKVVVDLLGHAAPFVVIDNGRGGFFQFAWGGDLMMKPEWFCEVEQAHFVSADEIPLDRATELAGSYIAGASDWDHDVVWQSAEPPSLKESDPSYLGAFDGIALRQVIKELERVEIEFKLEHESDDRFHIIVDPPSIPRAREIVAELFPV